MVWHPIGGAFLVLAAACVALPCAAQTALQLTGTAPLVCHADLAGPSAGANLGQVAAFCNDPAGVDVYLDYPTSLAGGTLSIDGVATALSASGTTRIAHSDGPISTTLALISTGISWSSSPRCTTQRSPLMALYCSMASRNSFPQRSLSRSG